MRRTPSLALSLALTLAALGAPAASPLDAQNAPPGRRQVIAINPLGVPFGWFNAEFERAVGAGATIGASGSYFDLNDEDDYVTSVEGKLRYYPAEDGLRGFAIGLTGGYLRFVERYQTFAPVTVFGPNSPPPTPTTVTNVTDGPTIGVTADYNWLLGARHRMLVGIGVGAKRIITGGDDDRQFEDNIFELPAYPTVRFVAGIAF